MRTWKLFGRGLVRCGIGAVLVCSAGQASLAREGEAANGVVRVGSETPNFAKLPTLSVTTRGKILRQPEFNQNPVLAADDATLTGHETVGPDRGTGCETVRTYSSANFAGGTYTVQAGMAQGEAAAGQYTITAGEFPIKIRTVECIWATQNATVATTTSYAIEFYSGPPSAANFITGFISDDVVLPNISLPIGSSAVNVQITIDPQDPDQVVIPAPTNGSNSFTVAWRIHQHNSPPANPCTQATSSQRNCFPTTDVGGVSSLTGNWIDALNCGSGTLCAPGGGWFTFQGLNALCRPSGDWNIRVTYEPGTCIPPSGACCFPNGSCQILSQSDCNSNGGNYKGNNTTCATQNCTPPNQACCFQATQGCIDLAPTQCTPAGGTAGGAGSTCATYVCFPVGACCLPNGTCADNTTPASCAGQGGTFKGHLTTCATTTCPPAVGACCFPNSFCIDGLTQTQCTQGGANWKGALSTCADGNSNGTADVCEATPCPGDFNNDHARNTGDLTALLGKFGQNVTPGSTGDMNNDGTVNTADLTAFLGLFGVPCP